MVLPLHLVFAQLTPKALEATLGSHIRQTRCKVLRHPICNVKVEQHNSRMLCLPDNDPRYHVSALHGARSVCCGLSLSLSQCRTKLRSVPLSCGNSEKASTWSPGFPCTVRRSFLPPSRPSAFSPLLAILAYFLFLSRPDPPTTLRTNPANCRAAFTFPSLCRAR